MSDLVKGSGNKSERNKLDTDKDNQNISNISGGITDEEFAEDFLAYPAAPNEEGANYQFNFLGAELEKVEAARKVNDELKK